MRFRSLLLALIGAIAGGCGGTIPASHPSTGTPFATASPNPVAAQSAASGSTNPGAAPVVGAGEPWIAYQHAATGGGYGVHLVRSDGAGVHWAMAAIPGKFQEHPDWSPDGRRIVFSETEVYEATEDLWIADVDGSNAERIVDCQTPCVWADEPAWSPDGKSIAFQRTVRADGRRTSTIELFDIAQKSTRIVLVAPDGTTYYAPRWSPDGMFMVAEKATNGATIDDPPSSNAIAIIGLTTSSSVREITKPALLANNPDWSPRGDLIVFSLPAGDAGFDGPADLFTVRPDGTGSTSVTSLAATGGRAYQPTFTPDGTRILFVREAVVGSKATMASIPIDGGAVAPATTSGYIEGVHPRLRPTP